MFLSFILIALAALGGLALTYLFAEKETFLWRLAAGNIVGSSVFGLAGFTIANFFGLSAGTAAIGLLIAAAPVFLLRRKDIKTRFKLEWHAARSRTHGTSWKKFLRVAYYFAFFLLFVFFFDRAFLETSAGILTGASQNTGDLPFHLGAIFSFTDGNNFPPENPSFAGAKFSYPFIADFLTACLMKFGVRLKDAMFVQNLFWALSLLVILERFVFKLTNSVRREYSLRFCSFQRRTRIRLVLSDFFAKAMRLLCISFGICPAITLSVTNFVGATRWLCCLSRNAVFSSECR
jgi:hypothetical protein